MPAPAYVAHETTEGNGTSGTVNRPAGADTGHWLIMQVVTRRGSTTTHTTPSGWSPHGSEQTASGTNRPRMSLYSRKIEDIATEATSYTVNFNQEAGYRITVEAVSGGESTNIVDAVAFATGTSGDPTCPTVDTNGTDRLICRFACEVALGVRTAPASHTERWNLEHDNAVSSARDVWAGNADAEQAALGATGTAAWGSAVQSLWVTATLALRSTADVVPPVQQSGRVPSHGTTARITFDEPVTGTGAGWSFTASGGAVTPSSAASDGNDLVITLSRTINKGETITASYDDTTGDTEDLAGNPLASFSDLALENESVAGEADDFFPKIRNEDWVVNEDATQQSVDLTATVVSGKQYAFGVVYQGNGTGEQLQVVLDPAGTNTQIVLTGVGSGQLANHTSAYFEDGEVWTATVSGTFVFRFRNAGDAEPIRGIAMREAVGMVEDHLFGVNCSPHVTMFSGVRNRLGGQLYANETVGLWQDDVFQGTVFSGGSNDFNHNAAAVVAMASGVAVVGTGHNGSRLDVRYLPSGAIGSITSTYAATETSFLYSYCQCRVVSSDRLAIWTRGGISPNRNGTLVIVSDVAQIGGTGASHQTDILVVDDNSYTPWVSEPDTDHTVTVWNPFDSGNWGRIAACITDFSVSPPKHYTLAGNEANVNSALGTEAAPRFTETQYGTLTHVGNGVELLDPDVTAQQLMPYNALAKITQHASGATPATASVLIPYMFKSGGFNTYGTTELRWMIHTGTNRYLSASGDFSGPAFSSNSYRTHVALRWKDDDPTTDTAYAVVIERGTRLETNFWGEEINPYYDQGGQTVKVYRIDSPLDPALISFTLIDTQAISGDWCAAYAQPVYGDATKFQWQTKQNGLHDSHGQSEIETYTLSVTSQVSPDDATHAHTAESPTITQTHTVTPDDAAHAHTAESPTITQAGSISPDSCLHGHTAESPTITQIGPITPDDCLHAHSGESPSVIPSGRVAVSTIILPRRKFEIAVPRRKFELVIPNR